MGVNVPTETRKYVWGAAGLAYMASSLGNVDVYHTDGLGSVRAISDTSAQVVQTYATDEFGIPTDTQGSLRQGFQWTGEERDENDLVFLRARSYLPDLGRFLQRDPLPKSGPGIGGWNRYSYVGNSPLNFVDPRGLKNLALTEGEDCLRTVTGACITLQAPASTPTPEPTQVPAPQPCPLKAQNLLSGFVGPAGAGAPTGSPFRLQVRTPATDSPNGVCHVNAEVPMRGSNASYINWHITYSVVEGFTAFDTGVWPGSPTIVSGATDAVSAAVAITSDVTARLYVVLGQLTAADEAVLVVFETTLWEQLEQLTRY